MSCIQDCSARCFVNATRFHTNAAVLTDVNKTNTVSSADFVKLCHKLKAVHLFAVYTDRDTLFEFDFNIFTSLWSILRANSVFEHVLVVWLVLSLLKLQALVRDVPDILVARVRLVLFHRNFKTAVFKEFNLCVAAVHVPFRVTPCCDYTQVRSESFDCKLKTNLVVALSCSTVTDCNGTFLTSVLNKDFSDKRAGCRSAQKILILVFAVCFECRPDVFFDIFLTSVYNIAGTSTSLNSTTFDKFPVIALTNIDTNSDNVIIIIFFEPRNDNRCVQTA